MNSAEPTTHSSPSTWITPSLAAYWRKRLFRIFGLMPLGIYVLVHLYNNNKSHLGADAFNQHLESWHRLPFLVPLTIVFLYLPLAWHMIYGLVVAKQGKPNVLQYGYFSNLKYLLQRLSGLGLALFLPAHIFKTKIEPILESEVVDFNHMAHAFSEPLTLTVYALGILGVSFHLANGIWEASITQGWLSNTKAQKAMTFVSILIFVAVFAMGASAILGFRAGM